MSGELFYLRRHVYISQNEEEREKRSEQENRKGEQKGRKREKGRSRLHERKINIASTIRC